MIVDVHAHMECFQDVATIVQRARQAGITTIISNGSNHQHNKQQLLLASKFPEIKAALGLHPMDAMDMTAAEREEAIGYMIAHKQDMVAVGEIGLDYKRAERPEEQQQIFELQLELAREWEKPVIVHSRGAEKQVIATLKAQKNEKVVLHAFHGNMQLVKQGAEAGFLFSIPANINRSSHVQNLVKTLPIHALLTETDAPFLSPQPDIQSEPSMIKDTIRHIAQIKALTEEETTRLIFANYQQLFCV